MKSSLQRPSYLIFLCLATLAPLACRTSEANRSKPKQEGDSIKDSTHGGADAGDGATLAAAPQQASSGQDARLKQIRTLEQNTPLQLNIESLHQSVGFPTFPDLVFTPKGGAGSPMAHNFLEKLGQQVHQQALLGSVKRNEAYSTHAARLLNKIVSVDLNFKSDPNAPQDVNDNRYLEAAWFMSNVARGALILEKTTTLGWKTQNNWPRLKQRLNRWIDSTQRNTKDARIKPMIQLISDRGTMNWVSKSDNGGATNRTFAMLEAQMRIAELRGGALSGKRRMSHIFQDFRSYLPRYFTTQVRCLGDASIPNSAGQDCLKNKDEPRKDTYHPLMGLASIVHIIEIAKRNKLNLSDAEAQLVIKGLRWGADNNTARPGGFKAHEVNHNIDLWETAYRVFPNADLGPLVNRDRYAQREKNAGKAGLAWGYSLVGLGKY